MSVYQDNFRAVSGIKVQTEGGEATIRFSTVLTAEEDPRLPSDAVRAHYEMTGPTVRTGYVQITKDRAEEIESLTEYVKHVAERMASSASGEIVLL